MRVSRPAAWLRVPLALLPVESDPARDDPPRYSRPLRFGWASIARSVAVAVEAAQSAADSDVLAESRTVAVPAPRLRRRRFLVADWLLDGPVIDPRSFRVVNGRHRLWGSRAAGMDAAPALDDHLDWAISATVEDWWGAVPDLDSVAAWRDDRAWWDSPEARPWRVLNPRHPETLDAVIEAWADRL